MGLIWVGLWFLRFELIYCGCFKMIWLFIGFGLIIGIWFKLMVFVIMGWFHFGVKVFFFFFTLFLYNPNHWKFIIWKFVWHVINSWKFYKKNLMFKQKRCSTPLFFSSFITYHFNKLWLFFSLFIAYHFNKLWRFCRINLSLDLRNGLDGSLLISKLVSY